MPCPLNISVNILDSRTPEKSKQCEVEPLGLLKKSKTTNQWFWYLTERNIYQPKYKLALPNEVTCLKPKATSTERMPVPSCCASAWREKLPSERSQQTEAEPGAWPAGSKSHSQHSDPQTMNSRLSWEAQKGTAEVVLDSMKTARHPHSLLC
jgi:hypothetical protein